MTTLIAGLNNPTETRLNLTPVPVKIIVPTIEKGQKAPKIRKGGLLDYLDGRTYYFPEYDANNPQHAGLGTFVVHSDLPNLPVISVYALCEPLTDDLSKASSYGDLLRIVFPKYIETRDFMDAVDEAIKTLSIYHGASAVDRILARLDETYFLDLTWLRSYGKMRNALGVDVTVVDFDGNVTFNTTEDQPIVRWNTISNVAVLTLHLTTGAELHYYITPDYFSGETHLKLVRASKIDGKFELYVDRSSFLHVLEAKDFFGNFMHLDISYASTRYYVEHGRAPIASLGSLGEDSANGIDVGRRFAIAYIDRTAYPNRQQYIDDVKALVNSTPKVIDGETQDVAVEEPKQNDQIGNVHTAETQSDTENPSGVEEHH